MVNVFGHYLADISERVEQIRQDQYQSTSMLSDAVGTVVKSQAALALGLERMVKSTATLAKNAPAALEKAITNPGVVMNGKILMEGNALRKSQPMMDETGRAVVVANEVEARLTKSLVGTTIQQAVLDNEYSPKEALRWLTETDSPTTGPVGVFRQLPPKLQERIVAKIA